MTCRAARSAARRAQDEADALKREAAELRQKADELLQNLRAAEDDVSKAMLMHILSVFTCLIALTDVFLCLCCTAAAAC